MTDRIQHFEDLTRKAVREVFHSMVSMDLTEEPPAPFASDPAGQIIGSVGFIGLASGVIYLYAGVGFATTITSRMLGIPKAEVNSDDMVNDAVGELSNMVVGYVKSRLCDAGWSCTLTIPSIVRGHNLSVEGSSQTTRRVIGFSAEENHLLVELLLKESQT